MSKSRVLMLLLALLLVIPSGLLSGCGGGESNAIKMMKYFPIGHVSYMYGYMYVNMTLLRQPEFHSMYRNFVSSLDLSSIGMTANDLDWMAGIMQSPDNYAAIVVGNVNPDKVKEDLDKVATANSYRGVQVWNLIPQQTSFALIGDTVLWGIGENVYYCIDVVKGLEQSIYDNSTFRDVMYKLPEGFTTMCTTSNKLKFQLDYNVVVGMSIKVSDSNTAQFTLIAEFPNNVEAQNHINSIRQNTEAYFSNCRNVKAVQTDHSVKVTGLMSLPD